MSDEPSAPISPSVFQAMAWFFINSEDAFLAIDRETLHKVNPVWTRRTGWEPEQSEGRPFLDFVHPSESVELWQAWGALENGQSHDGEFRLRAASGDWLSMKSHVVRGERSWLLAILRDVTAERLREREGEAARRAAQMVAATAGVTVWRYDPDTDHFEVNPDFTGSAPADTSGRLELGNAVRDAIHREDARALWSAWNHTLASGEPGQLTYRERDDEGRWRHTHGAWQGVRPLPSGRWEILGIAQDVTELTEARDRALAGAVAKSQFLANVSHEIRTPMNGVLGILHLLAADPPEAERKRLIKEALASGAGLSDLLNDIIDYSDAETGHIELSPEAIDPAEQLQSVVALVSASARKKGLRLTHTAANLGHVAVDPHRLRKVFFHLIGNAVKFTATGSIDIRLTIHRDGASQRLRLEVEDTGAGIPHEAQAGLFERFNQADGSMTRRFGGLGLGLAVTRRLAELMGGAVGFASVPGAGSTFWVEVSAPACEPPRQTEERGWLTGLRVLVVEDNPTNRLVATKMLGILGADVDVAEDGAEGVAAVERCPYDLVFMDIQMPVMDGVEATRRIRAMDPPRSFIPIVATTANVMPEQLATYRTCGINGVIAKPISPSALLAEVFRIANDVDREPAEAAGQQSC